MNKVPNTAGSNTGAFLKYSGHLHLRTRLVLSILSGKTLRIDRIRPNDSNPGLRGVVFSFTSESKASKYVIILDFEVSLLRLVEKATNGTLIEISYTGKHCAAISFNSSVTIASTRNLNSIETRRNNWWKHHA